jgi:signal transduction histidine kinase
MSRDEVRTYATTSGERVPSVLVVDNDPLIVALLTGLLSSQKYSVLKSYSGMDALKIVQAHHVDLIICDLSMSHMDGYQVWSRVRKEASGAEIPFVFMTASNGDGADRGIFECGVVDFVSKPLDPQALLAAVTKIIEPTASSDSVTRRDFDEYRQRVLRTLSHEFRTPLNAINVGMELLTEHQQSLDSERVASVLEAVRRGGQRLERLVKDFLLLQQMEAGITHEVFSSHAAVLSTSELMERFMSHKIPAHLTKEVTFSLRDRSEGARVRVVESQILDCLDRLVSNAIKFSEGLKEVEIDLDVEGREARFSVKDRGCGLPPEHIEAACELFTQIDRDAREQQGGGMGLAIARRYATAHQGRLEFGAREGGGAIVTLVLPLVDEATVTHTDPLMREH